MGGSVPLWIADYHAAGRDGLARTRAPVIPRPWIDWLFWQFDGNGGLKLPHNGVDADFACSTARRPELQAPCTGRSPRTTPRRSWSPAAIIRPPLTAVAAELRRRRAARRRLSCQGPGAQRQRSTASRFARSASGSGWAIRPTTRVAPTVMMPADLSMAVTRTFGRGSSHADVPALGDPGHAATAPPAAHDVGQPAKSSTAATARARANCQSLPISERGLSPRATSRASRPTRSPRWRRASPAARPRRASPVARAVRIRSSLIAGLAVSRSTRCVSMFIARLIPRRGRRRRRPQDSPGDLGALGTDVPEGDEPSPAVSILRLGSPRASGRRGSVLARSLPPSLRPTQFLPTSGPSGGGPPGPPPSPGPAPAHLSLQAIASSSGRAGPPGSNSR